MEGRLRANMLWDSIVRYKTERGALGSKTGYPRLDGDVYLTRVNDDFATVHAVGQSSII